MHSIKKFFKKFKYALLIALGALLLSLVYVLSKRDSALFIETFDFFNRNIKKYSLYNSNIDKETFEKIEKVDKRKAFIEKEIKQKFKEDNKKLETKTKVEIKRQLDEFTDNEEELEEWYRKMLGSDFSTSNNT